MIVKEAIDLFKSHQKTESKKGTRDSYNYLLQNFDTLFGDRQIDTIKPDEIYHFL